MGLWDTNRLDASTPTGVTLGVLKQSTISAGAIPTSLAQWNNAQLTSSNVATKNAAIDQFANFLNNVVTNLVMQAPFTPTAKFSHSWTWQANDPLVHYSLGDLTAYPQLSRLDPIVPPSGLVTNLLVNIGRINDRYQPWGGTPIKHDLLSARFDYNLAFKDPLVRHSDDWDFPIGLPLDVGWLGRVHRGTPWQTIYLKSAGMTNNADWQIWTGNPNPLDAGLTQPTNDWRLVSALALRLNTNSPAKLLSINQINAASWIAAFPGGLLVLTNTATDGAFTNPPGGQFAPLLMDTNAPQTGVIIDAINAVRASRPGHFFRDVGEILAVPELSASSPWLHLSPVQQQSGISDAAYEILPAEILSSLRPDSIGSAAPRNDSLRLSFTGFDGYSYRIETSTNLQDWLLLATNSPVNGVFTSLDPAGTSQERRYYRSVLLP